VWGLGIGDWGLGIGPNPQSPIPNPQSPIPNPHLRFKIQLYNKKKLYNYSTKVFKIILKKLIDKTNEARFKLPHYLK